MPHTATNVDLKSVLKDAPFFSSFAVKDVDSARAFYGTKLGLDVRDGEFGITTDPKGVARGEKAGSRRLNHFRIPNPSTST